MRRLKDGFDSISPTTRTRAEIKGIVISLTGMILGLVIMVIYRIERVWFWVSLSLLGGVVLTVWQLIGKMQNYRMLKKQDKIMEELEKNE